MRFRASLSALLLIAALLIAWRLRAPAVREGLPATPEPAGVPAPPGPAEAASRTTGAAPVSAADPAPGSPVAAIPSEPFSDHLAVRAGTMKRWHETKVDLRSGTLAELMSDLETAYGLIARADEAIARDPESWHALRYGGAADGYISLLAKTAGLDWLVDAEGVVRFGTPEDLPRHEPLGYDDVRLFLRLSEWAPPDPRWVEVDKAAWKKVREARVAGLSPECEAIDLDHWFRTQQSFYLFNVDYGLQTLREQPILPAQLALEDESVAAFLDRLLPPAGLAWTVDRGTVLVLTSKALASREASRGEASEERSRCERELAELLRRAVKVWGTGVPLRTALQRMADALGVTARFAPEIWRSLAAFDFEESSIPAAELVKRLGEQEPLHLVWRFEKLWILPGTE
ncbi:MAG: hypothetical protein FD180_4609 [Planctomycetota bacterium]|nr:MAG: hypothetical protein FD180_4609 [Planctomycetota bacterium]